LTAAGVPQSRSEISSFDEVRRPPRRRGTRRQAHAGHRCAVAGFSFHIGSQAPSVEPYREALQGTLDLIGHIDETLGGPTLIIDAIAAVVDDVLGARRDEFTRRPSPTVSSPPPL
jgi:ornithine decarboxylase